MMKNPFLIVCLLFVATFAAPALGQPENFFGKNPPGTEPVKFLSETLHQGLCPHGQLAFAPDGSGVFWSAIALEGRRQTIFWSAFDGKVFSPPVVAPFAAAGNGGPAFSPDGRRLFFNAEIAGPEASSPKTMAIRYVERAGDGWTKPMTIEATADVTITKGQVSVARSGNIYFSGRILTKRAPAIFVSRFADGKYSPPEKLSGPIAEEPLLIVDPWIDPDERFMLISCPPAEGPPMLNDIGISRRQTDGTWGKPVRLSGPVNTSAFERFASLSPDGKYLFFIRAFGQQFVSDQAHFYWVETKDIPELKTNAPVLSGPYLGQKPPGMTPEVFAPGFVSTKFGELNSIFSPDGKEFYFSRRGIPGRPSVLMVTKLESDGWTDPRPLPFSGTYDDIDLFLCPDNQRLVFCSSRPQAGGKEDRMNHDFWVSLRNGTGWSEPEPFAPEAVSPAEDYFPVVTLSETLYLNSQREGRGTNDIYASKFSNGKYLPPEKLPAPINTSFREFDAFVSPDEQTIIFSSERPGGVGGSDIYVSFRDGKGGWSEPANLGPDVNSERSEYGATISPDGRFLFFTSSKTGNEDIYWVSAKLIDEFRPMKEKQS